MHYLILPGLIRGSGSGNDSGDSDGGVSDRGDKVSVSHSVSDS